MKKAFKSILAVALCCIMLLGSIAIGGDGFAEILDAFMLKVSAATIGSYSKGDIVEFGWYPQTKETDAGIISALNSSGSQWYSYEYYSGSDSWSDGKMMPSDYMRYTDVMYGGNKYRGVVFDSYRPYYTGYTSSYNYQSSNGYYTNTVYWFKYEPIKWRVLDPSTGMVMSEMILDSQAYNNFILSSGSDEYGNTAYWGDAAKTYYANNYEKSSIREWLNNDFYNAAFSPKQQNVINFTTLDNSAYSTSYSAYDSASTSDKIYLLSWNDALNSNYGFNTSYSTYDTARRAQGSDYAKSQGLWVSTSSSYYGNSNWRLRSPGYNSGHTCYVYYGGYVHSGCSTGSSDYGVRPALNFNLKSDIFQCKASETGTASGSGKGKVGSSKNPIKNYSEPTLKIEVRHNNQLASGSVANIDLLTGSAKTKISGVTAKVGSTSHDLDKTDSVLETTFSKIGSQRIVFSAKKFFDYIIPSSVISSFAYDTQNNLYDETIYMRRDTEDGKPYVSTIFGRKSGGKTGYKELQSQSLTITRGYNYDFVITGGNLQSGKTYFYYISQDNSHKYSNTTGVFSSQEIFEKFDHNKKVYAYIKDSNGNASEAIELKLSYDETNPFVNSLKKGSLSIGGKNGFSITLPKDWVLVGGMEIDAEAFNFPIGYEYDGDTGLHKVSLGLDLTKYSSAKGNWDVFKNEVKGLKSKVNDYKDDKQAYNDMKNIAKKVTGSDEFSMSGKDIGFKLSTLGYLEFAIVNGEFVLKEGYVCVDGKLSIEFDYQGTGWVCGVGGGCEVKLSGTWARDFADDEYPISFACTLDIEPFLKLYGGVGIKKVASADIYGKATLPYENNFSEKWHSIALSGEVGVEAEFFIFKTGEIPVLDGTLGPKKWYYGNEVKKSIKASSSAMLTASADGTEVLEYVYVSDREYADNTSAWLGSGNTAFSRAKAPRINSNTTVTVKNLQTSVYSNSMADIVTCGNTVMAVWIEDDATRDTYNRMRLVYSLYDASTDTWSEPVAVYDDGCNDAAPSLATDGNNIYVVWQKVSKTLTESECEDMSVFLANTEIYLAKYDFENDEFISTTRLTNDNKYDYEPQVAILNGSPVVYYAKSENNAINDVSNNSIYQYENGSSTKIVNNVSSVYMMDCAVVGNQVELAYCVDEDNSFATTNDIAIYYGTNSFTKFDSGKGFTLNNLAYGKLDGTETLFVSDGVNIYYIKNGEVITVLEDASNVNGRLQVVDTENGTEILWTGEQECGNAMYACSYENGEWSNAVEICKRDSSLSNLAVANVNSKIIGVGNETLLVYDEGSQSYIKNGANLITFTENDCADIELTDIFVDETELVPGETATLSVYYKNIGNVVVESITVSVNDETTIVYAVDLLPGKESSFEIGYAVPVDYNGESIKVTAEISEIADSDVSNNSITYTCDTAKLVFDAETVDYLDGAYIVSSKLTNSNIAAANNVVVSAYFGETDGAAFDSVEVGSLTNGEYSDITFMFDEEDFEFDETGSCTVNLIAKADNSIENFVGVIVMQNLTECAHPETAEYDRIEPTCTTVGHEPGTACIGCGEYFTGGEEIAMIEHTDLDGDDVCDECGGEAEGIHVHNYVNATVIKQPTCTEDGISVSTCACGDTNSTPVPAKGHNVYDAISAKDPTCTEDGFTSQTECSFCNEIIKASVAIPATGHEYTSAITKKATCTANGVKTYICSICGDSYKETIKATGHKDKNKDGLCDECNVVVNEDLVNPCRNAKINVASAKTIDYKSYVTIKATATGVPEGYYLAIYVNGKQVAKGTNTEVTYDAGQIKTDLSYTVKVVDAKGNVQKDASGKDLAKDGGKISCNAGFFKKLIAFFKGLFGSLPVVTIKP